MKGLIVEKVNSFYGSAQVLYDVSIRVKAGEIVGLVGRNGVGKTTLLNSIVGLVHHVDGVIEYNDQTLLNCKPEMINHFGVVLVPQERNIFPELSVQQNLLVAKINSRDARNKISIDEVWDIFPELKAIQTRRGKVLSGGQQQMVAIARGLLSNPEIFMLDEPMEGLAPVIVERLEHIITKIANTNIGMVIAESTVQVTDHIADRLYVMEKGIIRWSGSRENFVNNQDVVKKYLVL